MVALWEGYRPRKKVGPVGVNLVGPSGTNEKEPGGVDDLECNGVPTRSMKYGVSFTLNDVVRQRMYITKPSIVCNQS